LISGKIARKMKTAYLFKRIFILAVIFLPFDTVLFAQEVQESPIQASATENKPEPEPAIAPPKIIPQPDNDLQIQEKPELRGYTCNLKRLLDQAKENIRKVDEEIKQSEIRKRNEAREAAIKEHFGKGNQLYRQKKLREAKEEWQKAEEISKDPEMKGYIKESQQRKCPEDPQQGAAIPEIGSKEQARQDKPKVPGLDQARIEKARIETAQKEWAKSKAEQERKLALEEKEARKKEKLAPPEKEKQVKEKARLGRAKAQEQASFEKAGMETAQKEMERLKIEQERKFALEQKVAQKKEKLAQLAQEKTRLEKLKAEGQERRLDLEKSKAQTKEKSAQPSVKQPYLDDLRAQIQEQELIRQESLEKIRLLQEKK
jgi:hypothetical protein